MRSCRDRSVQAGGSAIAGPDTLDQEVQARLARFVSLTGLPDMPLEAARRVNDEEAAVMFGPVEPVEAASDDRIAGAAGEIRIRIYRPVKEERLPALVYFHGGGWVVGSLDSHDGVARHLSRFGGCIVVSVDYRLAPEHPFPAAVEDAWAATLWVQEHAANFGGDGRRMAVGGDSAGGNLAAVVARHARDRGLDLALQLLIYPVVDCDLTAGDAEGRWWLRRYLRSDADALDLDASPLRAADLRGLAPAFVLSCGLDPLQAQAEAYVRRLGESGIRADHTSYPGLIHGAYRMPGVLPGARRMLEDSAAALASAFGSRVGAA
jgi:acetyl esterase